MSEANPLTGLYFFAEGHAGLPMRAIGQVGGCVAPGWFLVAVCSTTDPFLVEYSVLIDVKDMGFWVFFSTLDEAKEFKIKIRKARGY